MFHKSIVIIVGIAMLVLSMLLFGCGSSTHKSSPNTTPQKNSLSKPTSNSEIDAVRNSLNQMNKTTQDNLKRIDKMSPAELEQFNKKQKALGGYLDAQKQQSDNRSKQIDYNHQERLKAEERATRDKMANNPVRGYSLP